MSESRPVYIGTDCGATTSKVGAVWGDGTTVSTELLQRRTNADAGPAVVVRSWIDALGDYLAGNGLDWDQVQGVGLAIPGPFQRYGVLDKSANLPPSFAGFDVHTAYSRALADACGGPCRWSSATTAIWAASPKRSASAAATSATVLMLAPGSGLGCAFIDRSGLPLDGDTLAGMEAAHMPAPLHLLGARPLPCGCGRTWGCVEVYTTLSGLPHLLADKLAERARSSAGAVAARTEGTRAGAARPGAGGRRPGDRAVRLPGARARPAHRIPGDGARSAVRRDWRRADGSGGHDRGIPRALPADPARGGGALSVAGAARAHDRARPRSAISRRRLAQPWWRSIRHAREPARLPPRQSSFVGDRRRT